MLPTSALTPILTLALLAGGKGERLGGADKGLLQRHGQTLVAALLAQFSPQASRSLVLINRHLPAYQQAAQAYGAEVLCDDSPFQGPLPAMLTALQACHDSNQHWLLLLPADAWALPPDLLARLWQSCQQQSAPAAFAAARGQAHPVICLLRCDLQTQLRNALAAGVNSPWRWLQQLGASCCDIDVDDRGWSLNTFDELMLAGVSDA